MSSTSPLPGVPGCPSAQLPGTQPQPPPMAPSSGQSPVRPAFLPCTALRHLAYLHPLFSLPQEPGLPGVMGTLCVLRPQAREDQAQMLTEGS